ncbi:hypothetical protein L682_17160 [Aquipseudomonas alcaligenes OT 69]|nr:hypothetical protein L682_17160 [Pseudomonas alcaligenes OT 69]
MSPRIDITATPSEEDRAAILRPLRAHNTASAGDPQRATLALLVRDEHSDEVIGGL